MINDTAVFEKSDSIQFKSTITIVQYVLVGFLLAIATGLAILVSTKQLTITFSFLLFPILLLIAFSANATTALTEIIRTDDQLEISQYYKILDFEKRFTFPLIDVLAFDIQEIAKGTNALILYLTNHRTKRFIVHRAKEQQLIISFFTGLLPRKTAESHTTMPKFSQAFRFILIRNSCYTAVLIIFLYALNLLNLDLKWIIIATVFFGFGSWVFIVRKSLLNQNFRVVSYGYLYNLYSLIFIPASLIFGVIQYRNYSSKPAKLNTINQFAQSDAKLFLFENGVADPEKVVIKNFEIIQQRKSMYNNMKIYALTPLIDQKASAEAYPNPVWICLTLERLLEKGLSDGENRTRIIAFQNFATLESKKLFGKRPAFYELSHQTDTRTQMISRYQLNTDVIYLIPHYESLAAFKSTSLVNTIYLLLAAFGIALISSLITAYNR